MCFTLFFAYRCFRIKGTIRLKTSSKMALAGAKNDTKTRQKTNPKSQHTSDQKNTKICSKKVPQMGLFGTPGAPPGPPRTGQRAPGRPPGARMGTRRAQGPQNGPEKAPKWTQNGPKIDPHKGTVGEFTETSSSRQRPIRELQVTERVGGMRGAIE